MADFLTRELSHCQQIKLAAYDDPQCQMAWSESHGQPNGRADFSTNGPQPVQPTSPSGH